MRRRLMLETARRHAATTSSVGGAAQHAPGSAAACSKVVGRPVLHYAHDSVGHELPLLPAKAVVAEPPSWRAAAAAAVSGVDGSVGAAAALPHPASVVVAAATVNAQCDALCEWRGVLCSSSSGQWVVCMTLGSQLTQFVALVQITSLLGSCACSEWAAKRALW